mmetsp:Transcript_12093/g.39728  ORF Transcript_12093/g.39728 Transcript_12093/m.39728 type:complete len:220 (+) Transcript_12093:779-1438(+)
MSVEFYTASPTLFGVEAFVPALKSYIDRYGVSTHFEHTLVKVDGPNRLATFTSADGATVETRFDMLHVVPPMRAVECVRESPLADASGYVEVNPETLRHTRFGNVWAAGDAVNAPNSKTGAAARKQAPVVVHNLLQDVQASTDENGTARWPSTTATARASSWWRRAWPCWPSLGGAASCCRPSRPGCWMAHSRHVSRGFSSPWRSRHSTGTCCCLCGLF